MCQVMTALNHAHDRISFAAEGAALALGDGLDAVRDHLKALLALAAVAAAAIVLALSLGGEGDAAALSGAAGIPSSTDSSFVGERTFSLSLPAGWERTEAPTGSAFSAESTDGLAQATLWIERAPGLSFPAFVDQSLEGLGEIGSDARIADSINGSTLESRITTLQAEVPLDGGAVASYRVTLRAAGPNRYYLATVTQPGASPSELGGAETLSSTFRPEPR